MRLHPSLLLLSHPTFDVPLCCCILAYLGFDELLRELHSVAILTYNITESFHVGETSCRGSKMSCRGNVRSGKRPIGKRPDTVWYSESEIDNRCSLWTEKIQGISARHKPTVNSCVSGRVVSSRPVNYWFNLTQETFSTVLSHLIESKVVKVRARIEL